MKVAIVAGFNEGYDFLKEHLSFRQDEDQPGLLVAKGKLQNQPVLVIDSTALAPDKLAALLRQEEITYLISLGLINACSRLLTPGDVLIAGEIDSISTAPKLVDWCLSSVDHNEELTGQRIVVGSLQSAGDKEQEPEAIYGLDPKIANLSAIVQQTGIEALFIRIIGTGQEEEHFAQESSRKFFWLVKGVLDRIAQFRQHLTSEVNML